MHIDVLAEFQKNLVENMIVESKNNLYTILTLYSKLLYYYQIFTLML